MLSKMQKRILPIAKFGFNSTKLSPYSSSSSFWHLFLAFALLSLFVTHSTSLPFGHISMDDSALFVPWSAMPARSRAFVGIRTLPPSKAIFGARQLKEKLAEQAEQRREQRQAALDQQQNEEQSEQEQRRQRIYDRLLCMAALQNLAQCRDI